MCGAAIPRPKSVVLNFRGVSAEIGSEEEEEEVIMVSFLKKKRLGVLAPYRD